MWSLIIKRTTRAFLRPPSVWRQAITDHKGIGHSLGLVRLSGAVPVPAREICTTRVCEGIGHSLGLVRLSGAVPVPAREICTTRVCETFNRGGGSNLVRPFIQQGCQIHAKSVRDVSSFLRTDSPSQMWSRSFSSDNDPVDHVNIDEPIAIVETDKVTIDVPSPESGAILKFHQYQVVGRALPTETDEHPKIYRMKLWATNEVRAKSNFWYFLRKLKKVKMSNGQMLAINAMDDSSKVLKFTCAWLYVQKRFNPRRGPKKNSWRNSNYATKKIFPCIVCRAGGKRKIDYMFKSIRAVMAHYRVHNKKNGKNLFCPKCGNGFRKPSQLKSHPCPMKK